MVTHILIHSHLPPLPFSYVKHQYYDLAADVLAENTHLTYKYLSPDLYEFLDASIVVQTSPEVSAAELHSVSLVVQQRRVGGAKEH